MASKYAVLFQEHHDLMQSTDALLGGAITEGRALTADEQARVTQNEARLDELDDVLSVERSRRALARHEQLAPERQRQAADARGASLSARLYDADEFVTWLGQLAPNGHIPSGARVYSPNVPLGGLAQFGALAPLQGGVATQAGALIIPDQYGLVPFSQVPLGLVPLLTQATTGSDSVEYVVTTSQTNNAAPVAEATDVTTGGTGVKPQSDLALARRSTTVKTIANWIAITRQALADAGQLRAYVDQFLLYALRYVLENEILNGDGTGEHFDGILHVAGTTPQAFSTDLLTTMRKAKTAAQVTAMVVPTAYVVNPADWETIDLLQDNEARYFFGGPMAMGTPRLWGTPVIESVLMPAGTAVLADWKFAVLFDREQASIQVSDSHADFFVKNLVAILAELRAALAVLKPAAFVKIALS